MKSIFRDSSTQKEPVAQLFGQNLDAEKEAGAGTSVFRFALQAGRRPVREIPVNSGKSPVCWAAAPLKTAPLVVELLEQLDLHLTLSNLGIAPEDIPWLAENCMKVSAVGIANNPVVFTQDDIRDIYKNAM